MSCTLVQTFPSWQVLLADLRCHGQSAHMGPGMPDNSVESAAADVLELLRHLRLFPEILIGHSFGGKVIMSMADQFGRIGPRLPRPVQVHCTSSAASPASFCLCITKGQIWLGPIPLQHTSSFRTGRPCMLQARPAMAGAGLQHALCHLQCLPCTPMQNCWGHGRHRHRSQRISRCCCALPRCGCWMRCQAAWRRQQVQSSGIGRIIPRIS